MDRIVLRVMVIAAITLVPAQAVFANDEAEISAPAIDYSAMTDDELLAIAEDPERAWLENPCAVGAPVMGELHRRFVANAAYGRGYYLSSALCADTEARYADGLAAVKDLENYLRNQFTDRLGFYFARRSSDANAIVERFGALADEGIRALEPESAWESLRAVRDQGSVDNLADIALNWMEEGKFGLLDIDLQPAFAIRALDGAVRQGKDDRIEEILSYIRSPSGYVPLLAERKYEAYWPAIEERVGPNLSKVSEEYADWAQARFANEPTDRDRFSDAARALHYAGEYESVIQLAQDWRKREGRGLEIEEGDGWALNLEAYAYDALGQRQKADEVFDYLAALNPDEHPWVVNFVINRALRLVGHRKWEQGLEAANLAQGVAEEYGNTYAKLLIAWSRSCALKKLGRASEAVEDIDYLSENESESPTTVARAMLCLDRTDDAVGVLLRALENEELRPRVLDAFQSEKFDLFYTPSELQQPHALLAGYPTLREAAMKHVRIIPDKFIPVAALKRK